jgi:hypothetical protein
MDDIDLDEDGPLRQEYLPRRRVSRHNSLRSCSSLDTSTSTQSDRFLPPPAKWSPHADEPLLRSRPASLAQYLAPIPPPGQLSSMVPPPAPQPAHYRPWPSNMPYLSGYSYDPAAFYPPPRCPVLDFGYHRADVSHARHHSVPYVHYPVEQPRVSYGYSDMRMTAHDDVASADAMWSSNHHGYGMGYGPAFPHAQSLHPLQSWVRA